MKPVKCDCEICVGYDAFNRGLRNAIILCTILYVGLLSYIFAMN